MDAISGSSNIDLLPLAPPPPGIIPNFVDPPDRTYQFYIVAGVCLPLILVFASLRFYAKICLLPRSRDDCKSPTTLIHALPGLIGA